MQKALVEMEKVGSVEKTGKYYYPRKKSYLVEKRESAERLSHIYIKRAREIAAKIQHLPGIRAIYITGSLAIRNVKKEDDIDFMIVTNSNKLWTTRFLVTAYCSLSGIRRTPKSKENAGKVCLNLYLTEKSFQIPQAKQNLYTAYELIQAVPIYDPKKTHSKLLSENAWISKYLPNVRQPKTAYKKNISSHKDFLEKTLFKLQKLYMKSHITHEFITEDAAFFHPDNPGKIVIKKLSNIVQK